MDLPLLCRTPPAWAHHVLSDPQALLSDHAWLEKKAANHALTLLSQWPSPDLAGRWVRVMSGVARDETQHLAMVCRHLRTVGGTLTRSHQCAYAASLKRLVRLGGRFQLLDGLLVAALIEARSCERFALLAEVSADADLRRLYDRLVSSEAGHYRVFVELATRAHPGMQDRWNELLAAESDIVQLQPWGSGMHSGFHTP
jgi:tRNA-(ms[2]io[6]A)-hydroxylase